MLAQTRFKHRWAEKERDDTSASPPTAVPPARSSATSGTRTWTYRGQVPSLSVDHIWRLLDQWLLDETPEAEQPPTQRPMNLVLAGQVGNIVWSTPDLDESLRHALDSARRQLFEDLVTAWKAETVFVSSVTEKWSHPAYESIIAMGKPAIPLILEQIGDGERLWTQALLSITAENPAEATRTPEEAQQAWLKWGEVSGWLNP